jgi:hypothetical protein
VVVFFCFVMMGSMCCLTGLVPAPACTLPLPTFSSR